MAGHETISFDRFRVCVASRRLWADEEPVAIGARALDLLIVLLRRPGELVSRRELVDQVWSGAVVEDNAVAAQVSIPRRTLGDGVDGARFVQTVPGRGYRFVGGLASPPDATREEPTAGIAGQRPGKGAPRHEPLSAWIGVALAALVLAVAGAWLVRDRLATPPAPREFRVGVLPFDAVGPGREARDFSDALFDRLIGVLYANQVQVAARSVSGSLRGSSAAKAAAALGADVLIDGAVAGDGRTLDIRVHIDDARQRLTLWSKEFTGPVDRADVLQREVAAHTGAIVNWVLSKAYGLPARIDRPTLTAFLEAADELVYGGDRTVAIYRQVVARAPDFSYGHTGLATALNQSVPGAPPGEQSRLLEEARGEALRGLALDPKNGESYRELQGALPSTAHARRERLLLDGLSVDPDPPWLPWNYANLLAAVGRNAESAAMARRAIAADPYIAGPRIRLAIALLSKGEAAQGQSVLAEAARLWPDDASVRVNQFYVAVFSGPAGEVLGRLADGLSPAPGVAPSAVAGWRAFVLARDSADPARRARAARLVLSEAGAGRFPLPDAMMALSRLGDVDGAFDAAARLYSPDKLRQPYVLFPDAGIILFVAPTAPMRRDVRFLALAARLGLVDYWRTSGQWPGFCAEPGLPYDCRAVAGRLTTLASR